MSNKKVLDLLISDAFTVAHLTKKECEFWVNEAKNARDDYDAKEATALADQFLLRVDLALARLNFLEGVLPLA